MRRDGLQLAAGILWNTRLREPFYLLPMLAQLQFDLRS